jgi:hypothetical protein
MAIDNSEVRTIRMINPTAMATIRRLIDCRMTEPEIFLNLSVRVFEMSRPPGHAPISQG